MRVNLSPTAIRNILVGLGVSASLAGGGAFIASHEGIVTHTYYDLAGVATNCVGNTRGVVPGQVLTVEQCLANFAEGLAETDAELSRLTAGITLSEGERNAYRSFLYNYGASTMRSSTLYRKLLAGHRLGACLELTEACGKYGCNGWVYAGDSDKPVAGLVARRAAEQQMCLDGIGINTEALGL